MNGEEEQRLFRRAYDLTGHGLSDYLRDFFEDSNIRATQHGEAVIYRNGADVVAIFSAWHAWRQEASYYFDDFLAEWQERFSSVDEEEFMEVLVFKLARILGILDSIPAELVSAPQEEESFLFW